MFERGVISMMPSLAWQTHVSGLPGAVGHFVPVGPAEVRGLVTTSSTENRDTTRADIAIVTTLKMVQEMIA